MPLNEMLPADIDRRLVGLAEAIAAAAPDVEFAYVFGSAALGRLTPRSDIDLALFVSERADAGAVRLDVALAGTRHLGTDALDVVVLNSAPIALAGRILTTRRVLFDRAPFTRHRYESLTARMFHDFRIREHRMLAHRYARG